VIKPEKNRALAYNYYRKMKKFTLFFFLLQMTFLVMAQSEPAWVDSDQRRAFYPDEHILLAIQRDSV
jgi:hypothetical protein